MSEINFNSFDQEKIYDLRYEAGYNGTGSPVSVLSAEREAAMSAIRRLQRSLPEGSPTTVADYGSGISRLPNMMLSSWVGPGDFTYVGFDVSKVGLERAMEIVGAYLPTKLTYEKTDRVVGVRSSSRKDKYRRTAIFVHGSSELAASDVADILIEENGGEQFGMTMAIYDSVSHHPTQAQRMDVFRMLGLITKEEGELMITASTVGDLIPAYLGPHERLFADETDANGERDVVYSTEIGESNYIHLFGSGFRQYMQATRTALGQGLWLEPIRMQGPEYATGIEEAQAFGKLRLWQESHMDTEWTNDDFASIHTVGGFRSPLPPAGQKLL